MKGFPAIILMLLISAVSPNSHGQERLDALTVNPSLKADRNVAEVFQPASNRMAPLSLPFFDDFYPLGPYPDSAFWVDDLVFVNATFPIAPPTIGVATFDGLNAMGEPYSIIEDDHGVADLLTSRPIDLSGLTGSEDIYLSFYWQPTGLGDPPDYVAVDPGNQDMLLVEFLDTSGNWDSTWVQIWTGEDSMAGFRQEFIPIDDGQYLFGEFQFRFKAIGRLTGAFDHWHIDYVRLDRNRDPEIEQNIAEMAYQYLPSPLLTPYYAMPYNQFDSTYVADTHSVFIRNNFNQVTTDIIDFYLARELTGPSILDAYAGPSTDVGPLISFREDYSSFEIPEDLDDDTVTVRVIYNFLVSAEDTSNVISNRNNRVVRDQVFSNFFSYDDASAEKAYILEVRRNDALYGQVAVGYYAPEQDTLRAVRMNLVNYNGDIGNTRFTLLVWKAIDSDTAEAEVVYRQEFLRVDDLLTGDSVGMINGFTYVTIDSQYIVDGEEQLEYLLVEGQFYVGYEVDVDVELPVGFDLNTDGSDFHYINLGQGWSPTQFSGSIMINPVLGGELPPRYVVSAASPGFRSLGVEYFPNPAAQWLQVRSDVQRGRLAVVDLTGRVLLERNFSRSDYIQVEHLAPGIYILQVTDLDTEMTGAGRFIRP